LADFWYSVKDWIKYDCFASLTAFFTLFFGLFELLCVGTPIFENSVSLANQEFNFPIKPRRLLLRHAYFLCGYCSSTGFQESGSK
jgi:hypothetical protein